MPTLTWRDDTNGYTSVTETTLSDAEPNRSHGLRSYVDVDGDTPNGSGQQTQGLLRFARIFGDEPDQIPHGARIEEATLTLYTTNASADGATFHRMLGPWTYLSTWNSLDGGVQADGGEAVAAPDLDTGAVAEGGRSFDVTAGVQAWSDGAPNEGWAILPVGADGWAFQAEGIVLSVTYTSTADDAWS